MQTPNFTVEQALEMYDSKIGLNIKIVKNYVF